MSSQEVRIYSADSQDILVATYTQKALDFAYYLVSFASLQNDQKILGVPLVFLKWAEAPPNLQGMIDSSIAELVGVGVTQSVE